MAYWGIAYAAGPELQQAVGSTSIRSTWPRRSRRTYAATEQALGAAGQRQPGRAGADRGAARRATRRRARSRTSPAWNDAYADAMREVYRDYGDDLDVAALFAEALMNRTPWQLWDLSRGGPAEGAEHRRGERGAGARAGEPGQPRPPRRAAHVHPPDGDVAAPGAGAARRPTGCAGWCRTPATCSTCRPTSTCCAATTTHVVALERRRDRRRREVPRSAKAR